MKAESPIRIFSPSGFDLPNNSSATVAPMTATCRERWTSDAVINRPTAGTASETSTYASVTPVTETMSILRLWYLTCRAVK